MKTTTKRPSKKQSDSDLPLLNRAVAVVRRCPNTDAGRFIFRRYHVTPSIADVIAEAAGLGSEVR